MSINDQTLGTALALGATRESVTGRHSRLMARQGRVGTRGALALLFNPDAGNFSARRIDRLRAGFERAGWDVECHDSLAFRPEADGPPVDLICVCGGDGTVRTVIENVYDRRGEAAFCAFPAGTINLVAREVGYRTDPRGFISDLLEGPRRVHHVGRIGERFILCCASAGPDSQAVARLSPWLKKKIGRLAYGVAFLSVLRDWPRIALDIMVDGVQHQAESIFILKGRYFAGPWTLDREARLGADRFRVLLMARARRRDYLRLILFALFGERFADPAWRRLSARSVEIQAAAPVPIQIDGDILAWTPATAVIAAHPVQFI